MNCPHCGKEVADDATFCANCNKEIVPPAVSENTSGQGAGAVVPEEIKGTNIGALALGWIWAFAHRLWGVGIVALVLPWIFYGILFPPYAVYKYSRLEAFFDNMSFIYGDILWVAILVSVLAMPLFLFVKGNRLAWKRRRFDSIEHFQATQETWRKAGIVVLVFKLVIVPAAIFTFVFINLSSAHDHAYFMRCVESLTAIKIAEEMYITDYGHYTDKWDHLSTKMIAGCKAEDGSDCKGKVYKRISSHCREVSLEMPGNDSSWYEVKGIAMEKYGCKVCMTPSGYLPKKYNRKACSEWNCPGPREQGK